MSRDELRYYVLRQRLTMVAENDRSLTICANRDVDLHDGTCLDDVLDRWISEGAGNLCRIDFTSQEPRH